MIGNLRWIRIGGGYSLFVSRQTTPIAKIAPHGEGWQVRYNGRARDMPDVASAKAAAERLAADHLDATARRPASATPVRRA